MINNLLPPHAEVPITCTLYVWRINNLLPSTCRGSITCSLYMYIMTVKTTGYGHSVKTDQFFLYNFLKNLISIKHTTHAMSLDCLTYLICTACEFGTGMLWLLLGIDLLLSVDWPLTSSSCNCFSDTTEVLGFAADALLMWEKRKKGKKHEILRHMLKRKEIVGLIEPFKRCIKWLHFNFLSTK